MTENMTRLQKLQSTTTTPARKSRYVKALEGLIESLEYTLKKCDSMYDSIRARTMRINEDRTRLYKKVAKMKKRTKAKTIIITFNSGYQVGISGRPDVILKEILKMDMSLVESINNLEMTRPSDS